MLWSRRGLFGLAIGILGTRSLYKFPTHSNKLVSNVARGAKDAAIVDASGNIWTLVASTASGMQIACNNIIDKNTANVAQLLCYEGVIHQQNTTGRWWLWRLPSWQSASDPRVTTGTATDRFQVSNGRIIDPNGKTFIAKGINIPDWAAVGGGGNSGNGTNNGAEILRLFPGCNFVRLACQHLLSKNSSGYNDDPAALMRFITTMTAMKCVVEIEDHAGGNPEFGDSTEIAQHQWFVDCAKYYKNNPYVWFGSVNEPANTDRMVRNQIDTYKAVRSTDNMNPIMMQYNQPNMDIIQPHAANFAKMTNVIWDTHGYSWTYGGKATLQSNATANRYYAKLLASSQNLKSADGVIPIIIAEYGTSTTGATVDTSGAINVTAVQFSGVGSAAWVWAGGGSDRLQNFGALTAYGKEVAAYIAGKPPAAWVDSDGS